MSDANRRSRALLQRVEDSPTVLGQGQTHQQGGDAKASGPRPVPGTAGVPRPSRDRRRGSSAATRDRKSFSDLLHQVLRPSEGIRSEGESWPYYRKRLLLLSVIPGLGGMTFVSTTYAGDVAPTIADRHTQPSPPAAVRSHNSERSRAGSASSAWVACRAGQSQPAGAGRSGQAGCKGRREIAPHLNHGASGQQADAKTLADATIPVRAVEHQHSPSIL